MESFYHIIKIIHILAGATALVTGLHAMLTVKGGKANCFNERADFCDLELIFI